MFIQSGPDLGVNLFKQDALLAGLTRRSLPEEIYLLVLPSLVNMGEEVLARVRIYGDDAERNPPLLINQDAFGRRVDQLLLSSGWLNLKKFAMQHRLIALGYDKKLRKSNRLTQACMQILFSAFSSTYSCPIAMTDGAVKILYEHAPKSIKDQIIPMLLAKEEDRSGMCGQWMTERTGGSDLRAIETHATYARKEDDREYYRLFGLKWFASAADSEFALVLASIPEAGPSLFLVPVYEQGKLCEGIRIVRLKNKLGTRGMPTAEIKLEGAYGILIGYKGQGIRSAAPLLNITRFYNALASASNMNRAYFAVHSYAKRRESFGKPIIQHVLHHKVLADLDAKRGAAIVLCFEIARLMGEAEHDAENLKEKTLLRILIPLAKLCLGKSAVNFASEAMEAMGGVGYLEDTEFPQLLRDAQVLPIWEGTTNMMLLDIMRSEAKHGALGVLLKELCVRANAIMIDEIDALRILKSRLHHVSERIMNIVDKGDDVSLYLEPHIRKAALMIAACTQAVLLAEAKPFITEKDPFASSRFSTFVENNLCGNFSL